MARLISSGQKPVGLPMAVRRAASSLAERALGVISDPLIASQTQVEGLEHLPETGGAIVACRHSGVLDARLLNAVTPRPLTHIDVPMRLAGEAPWAEKGRRDGAWVALDHLRRGDLVLVFPEGRTSPDDLVHKGRTGLGALALNAAVPVIPAVVLTQGLTSRVIFGAPLDFTRFAEARVDRTVARGVTDEVMAAIADLAGLEYVDTYTSTARDLLRDQARERLQSRRVRAVAQREADRAAIQRHRQQVAEEAEDLAARVAAAADDARRHAELAALRDGGRRSSARRDAADLENDEGHESHQTSEGPETSSRGDR